jgi:cytidyltransferase-like protein|tara:strand:+ start:346 stop:1110 length:765 start_codon:yes stop_codon:yes gene_type:complete
MKVVLVTGGFDPLHSGHIAYLTAAKKLGDKLVVGINSDEWLTRKKGKPFMPLRERISIISALTVVDDVLTWDDSDDSACGAIFKLMSTSGYGQDIIFANGGDRTKENIPEMTTFQDSVEFVFGVGGEDKKNSSSWILEEYKYPKTIRNWGWYRVLDEQKGYKVKELVIEPGKSLSMQRHEHRAEHWYVLKGEVTIGTLDVSSDLDDTHKLKQNQSTTIEVNEWHQGINHTKELCHILEVQYGSRCEESDIIRNE